MLIFVYNGIEFANKINMSQTKIITNEYTAALKYIEYGQYERASDYLLLKPDLPTEPHLNSLKTLISFRLAIKANTVPLDGMNHLNVSNVNSSELKAEFEFVNGIYFNSCRIFKEASESFFRASQLYHKVNWLEKELFSFYNALISDINHSNDLMTSEHLIQLNKLQIKADEIQNKLILGFVSRQKSYFFKEKKKWNAALQEAKKAVFILEGRAFTSDYHLALLNIADCYLELNKIEKSRSYFEKVLHPIDPRVKYGYEYIKLRLSNQWNQHSYEKLAAGIESDPHFLYRAFTTSNTLSISKVDHQISDTYNLNTYFLDKNNGVIKHSRQEWIISKSGKEFLLLKFLADGPKSSEYIMSVLWPQNPDLEQLESRLYTLISRTNKKLNGIIKYEKGKYSINGILKEN